jgi:hypothetical protein
MAGASAGAHRFARLNYAPATEELKRKGDDGKQKENMDEPSERVRGRKADDPQNNQDCSNRPQHD